MPSLTLTLLAVVALLAFFLLFRFSQRLNANLVPERQWTGHGFDTSRVTPQLQRLRADYVMSVHRARPSSPGYHGELLATARRTVSHLGFFRARQVSDDALQQAGGDA